MNERRPLTRERWQEIKAALKAAAESWTWERQAAELERIARDHLPAPGERPEPGSDADYALRIVSAIVAARQHVERGDAPSACLEALEAGIVAGHWPRAREFRRRREQTRAAGRIGGSMQSRKAEDLEVEIDAIATEIRATHPHDLQHSTRWLAREIAKKLEMPCPTVRGYLKRMNLK